MDEEPDPNNPAARGYWHIMWQRFFGLNVSQIEPLLFVGGEFSPQQWSLLAQMGIQAVLSLQAERADEFRAPYPQRTLRLLVSDWHAPTLEQLADGVAFIRAAYAVQQPVLVHCRAGVGRAPTAAAAFLIAERGMAPAAALSYIRHARPIITPNNEQIARLHQWHARLTQG